MLDAKFKSGIIKNNNCIQKEYDMIKSVKRIEIDCNEISTSSTILAEKEQKKENDKLNAFCKFTSDKISMSNMKSKERIFLMNSFSLLCGF